MKSVARFSISLYHYNIIRIEFDNPTINSKRSDRFHSRSPSNLWHGLYFDIISLIFKSETPINNGPHHPILGFGKISYLLWEPEADVTANGSWMIYTIIWHLQEYLSKIPPLDDVKTYEISTKYSASNTL